MIPIAQSLAAQLGQLALESIGAAVGVSFCFSFALLGTLHAQEARSEGNALRSLPWLLLALLGYAGFAVLVVLSITVVVRK